MSIISVKESLQEKQNMNKSILVKIENSVAFITLNRPEVFNSFNREMALLLQNILDDCETNAEVRAIVLTGNGKAFCAGQDLKEVTTPELNPGFKKILEEHYNPKITRIRKINKPIIAAVNGVAAGAGANIALACDVVVASEKASFIQVGDLPVGKNFLNLKKNKICLIRNVKTDHCQNDA